MVATAVVGAAVISVVLVCVNEVTAIVIVVVVAAVVGAAVVSVVLGLVDDITASVVVVVLPVSQ